MLYNPIRLAQAQVQLLLIQLALSSKAAENTSIFHKRRSSDEMAELASLILNDRESSHIGKRLAGSVLSQYAPKDPRDFDHRRTSDKLATLAGRVLESDSSTTIEKQLAGSVLSQRAS